MKITKEMILETRVSILENALKDVKQMLISIDIEEEEPMAGVYARCAYARIDSALSDSNDVRG